jgi:hypothetical protein
MPRSRIFVFILLLILVGGLVMPVAAQSGLQVVSNTASLTFPDSILFSAEFQAGANITAVVLEYGVNQLTCGTVHAEAFPAVTAGTDGKVSWTWHMLQSGSLPPGSTIWWRWQVTDSNGTQFTSPQKTILWLDAIHPWKVITGGNINLHYYNGDASFGRQLHDAAIQGLDRLSHDVGLTTNSPVDIYIYANSTDMQAAVLYAPSWSGGQPFPESNIVIIGIPTDQLDWGKSTEAHELTHVLVGHLTFSCLGFIPLWLDEGLATYGEGGGQAAEQVQFDQAKAANQLPSLRSLTGAFSAESSRALLSYAVAYHVVDFLIKTYGRDKMIALLVDLRDGQTIDQALQAVYGFDMDGLETAWRTANGAKPLAGSSQPTPVPTPTVVPTYVPIGAAPVAAAVTATPQPIQPAATATPAEAMPGGLPSTGTPTGVPSNAANPSSLGKGNITTVLEVGLACLVILVLFAGLVLFLIVRGQNRSRK